MDSPSSRKLIANVDSIVREDHYAVDVMVQDHLVKLIFFVSCSGGSLSTQDAELKALCGLLTLLLILGGMMWS